MHATDTLINNEATIIVPALVQLFAVDVSLLSLLFLSSTHAAAGAVEATGEEVNENYNFEFSKRFHFQILSF